MSTVSLTINGLEVTVPKGTKLLDAALGAGFFIPTLCHDENSPNYGGCRICVVEVKGARALVASCCAEAANGMVVETESPAVVEARKTILELMLANHPADCLTCDKAGNCRLQDYAFRYDVKQPNFGGERKDHEFDDSNPYINRDMNKCILCARCVRTCKAVTDRAVIDLAYRGFKTKVATALDAKLAESLCVSCGRCVSVCPVGALTYRSFSGKARMWEVEKEQVTCTWCDAGCQFDLVRKDGKAIGVAAKNPSEGRPLCLKGRLGLELRYNDEPLKPMLKKDDQFVEVSWTEALGLEEIVSKLK
ncbi:2Fe-2S iron-sulfur cluster-binding protein [Syntrophotalea acetylenica]|uniref:NADH dehydrogenase n=1 Tax=Syntrophotalea acetylenica TaxID=29542 RepID=A0A1L3GHL9_SYNAC|nr:2Fe-2S iron-sulfur cluster-binding protein [Syntrophotalea acetylenica]APG25434.1 NADH dehydrogenase [Syntrophotalea acetylenica]APG43502.1 NADH dehydrogenase [Syntrophotalea acetylenica]